MAIVDNPAIGNLVWEWTGADGAVLAPLSAFGATSSALFSTIGFYSTQDKSALPGVDESVGASNVFVPSVPESGSTIAFLGLGLIVVATLSRKMLG